MSTLVALSDGATPPGWDRSRFDAVLRLLLRPQRSAGPAEALDFRSGRTSHFRFQVPASS